MEARCAPSIADRHRPISPYKKIRNPPKKISHTASRSFISRSLENLPPMNYNNYSNNSHGVVLFAPRNDSLHFSYPPPSSPSVLNQHQQNYYHERHAKPLSFPLPISKPRYNSLPSRSLAFSGPPSTTRKTNSRPRDQSLTPKKSKQPNTKRVEEPKKQSLIIESTVPLGPDPKDLPKYVSKLLSSSSSPSSSSSGNGVINSTVLMEDFEKFSGSAFALSPHPSSLPLPKFSMRPKLMSCSAEAAGIDAGATDNLRRLLRLR
ncbi:hypothetical protein OIU77_020228 [Salix suchowensis]|uniref:Uncharacterized protein n=1 Tax=Salix suchowensis TaxID=1278906 RepID=A0ABQ9CNN2_9ROSI|nr:hypothetical protein OIU77_020228 [Salix suchowensis]